MLFVLDVGNTNTVLGVFDGDTLKYQWRIKTDRHKTEDEYGMLILSLFEHNGINVKEITGVAISSVVPPIMTALEQLSRDYFELEPVVVSKADYQSLLKMNYPRPTEIGADRIVNAVAAIKEYGAPLIIIDFGTATTYCYINEKQEYNGGIITPGMSVSLEALHSRASKLPKIDIEQTDKVIGKSTVSAMQSGIYFGTVEMIDGLVRRIKKEYDTEPKVIATGGFSSLIGNDSTMIDVVDPHLTLKGLAIIHEILTQ